MTADHYRLEESAKPEPADGEVLCRTLIITIGAGTRAGLQGSASYAGAPKTGIVMNADGVARVEASRSPAFKEGDLVVCPSAWQDYSVHKASALEKVIDDIDIAREKIKGWIESGKLKPRNDEVTGLEAAPSAFVDLLVGGNIGTRTVRIAE